MSGWAANRADGAVEAVFEGPSAAVELMLEFSRTGPDGAVVEAVEVFVEEPLGEQSFDIRSCAVP